MIAPIALFTYNRLEHTRRTIEALARNELASQSKLYVFSDGPKNEDDICKVNAVRKLLGDIKGFESLEIIAQESNHGLARSIIDGVTNICALEGRVVVIEDDLVTSSCFLRYINEALDLYEENPEVVSISGYVYPVHVPLPETFFIRGADCWGWATWKRGWDLFEPNGEILMAELESRKLGREFDFNHTYGFLNMLRDQVAGKNQSWAVRWYASAFLSNRLTLYPGHSLVLNIGLERSGTHCGEISSYDVQVTDSPFPVNRLPLVEDVSARKAFEDFFRGLGSHPSIWLRIEAEFRKLVRKILPLRRQD